MKFINLESINLKIYRDFTNLKSLNNLVTYSIKH